MKASVTQTLFTSMEIIEIQYLPQPAYLGQFLVYPELQLDSNEHYVKQTFRNRCLILTANGIDTLSIPVQGSGKKIRSKDIRIDHNQKWFNRHWRAIKSAYGRAPYFEYYADELHQILEQKHQFLIDLNVALLTQCLDFLHFDIELKFTETYHDPLEEELIDLRDHVSPKNQPQSHVAYEQLPYHQVFGNNFVRDMSVIDLLFCEGPNAGSLIRSSIKLGNGIGD